MSEIVQLLPAPPLTFAIFGNIHSDKPDDALFLDPVPAFALVREHARDPIPRVIAFTPNGCDLEAAELARGMIVGAHWTIYEDSFGHDARLPALLQAGDFDGACAVVVECYRRNHERAVPA